MAAIVDITERLRREAEIRELLSQKTVLLRELRHRIKNDVNLVRSLLRLQASRVENHATVESLTEASDRLSVLARVYDEVSKDKTTDWVRVREFLTTLVSDLRVTTLSADVTISMDIEDVEVASREAVSLGIIVNEIVTNAVKYAESETTPHIEVSFALDNERRATLRVGDNGPGFPEEVLDRASEGYGLTIIGELVGQHGGELVLKNNDGAEAEITGFEVS